MAYLTLSSAYWLLYDAVCSGSLIKKYPATPFSHSFCLLGRLSDLMSLLPLAMSKSITAFQLLLKIKIQIFKVKRFLWSFVLSCLHCYWCTAF